MKILFFIESLNSGGKERRLVELIKGLQNHSEIECELVLTRTAIHYKDIYKTGIKIHYIVRKYLKKDPRLFFLFYKITKKYHPDIIHVWGNMVAIYAIPAKLLLKTPMISNEITDAPIKVRKGVLSHKLTFPFSDLIISNTKAGINVYNAPVKKSLCIYNGFDFSRIKNLEDKEKIRRNFNIKYNKIVGMVANFTDKKDYKTYLLAAMKILSKRNDVSFIAVGGGKNLGNCEKMIKNEFKDNIIFTGEQNEVESIINICDIGILISNPDKHGEGISNALMEFMVLGKPVIATDGGGTKELVINGETGLLVKPKSVNDLVIKITYLLENKKTALYLGENSKRRIKKEFNLEKMTDSFINIYKQLLNKRLND